MTRMAFSILVASVIGTLGACPAPSPAPEEISRDRAVAIGRSHVSFAPVKVEAEKASEGGRPVWRVTFHGGPVSAAHPMGQVTVVVVDRRTGEVTALGMT